MSATSDKSKNVPVVGMRRFSSSGTWNWNNFAASNDDKSKNDDENKSQESQVLKKCGELYMSLMPLNEKVGAHRGGVFC